MSIEVEITPDMQRRIAAIAEQFDASLSDIIADALENGHSLEWQEQFIEKVGKGIAAADCGEFASPAEIERIRRKHQPS